MIRKKMTEIMAREAGSCDLKDLVAKFIPEAIGKEIEKSCQGEGDTDRVTIENAWVERKAMYALGRKGID